MRDAYENGLDVRGGWECRHAGDGVPGWKAVVVETTETESRQTAKSD